MSGTEIRLQRFCPHSAPRTSCLGWQVGHWKKLQ